MKLFRKEKIGTKIRNRYEIKDFEKELSMKLFELKGLGLSEIIIELEPEEMMPHEEIRLKKRKNLWILK